MPKARRSPSPTSAADSSASIPATTASAPAVTMGGIPAVVLFYRFLDNLIALAIIIFAINNKVEWIRKYFLESKAWNFLGKISYGLYIYHLTFSVAFLALIQYLGSRISIIHTIMDNDLIFWTAKFGALVFVSWLSFRFIEQPILRLKRKFEYSNE